MGIESIKNLNDYFKQILQKNLTKAINPQPTTAPTVPVKNYVGDLGARPQMTNPDMKELKFEASTSPWSALLVGLGLQNKLKNQTGLTNEQLAQSDYTDKFKTANDMNQYNQKKQSDLDFDAVDPNKIADREFKQGQILNQGWDSFLQGEKAPLEMQKLQASVDNMGKGSAREGAEAVRVGKVQDIFNELVSQAQIDTETAKEDMSTEDLNDMYQKAVLLSGDPKYALRVKGGSATKPNTLPFRESQEKRQVEKFDIQKKKFTQEEADKAEVNEMVDAIRTMYPNAYKNPNIAGKFIDKVTGERIDEIDIRKKLEAAGGKAGNINKAIDLRFGKAK